MIELLVAFLPMVIGLWVAHRIIQRSRPQPAAESDPGPATRPLPAADVVPDDDETPPTPWTPLDDIQLERLLRESSS